MRLCGLGRLGHGRQGGGSVRLDRAGAGRRRMRGLGLGGLLLGDGHCLGDGDGAGHGDGVSVAAIDVQGGLLGCVSLCLKEL